MSYTTNHRRSTEMACIALVFKLQINIWHPSIRAKVDAFKVGLRLRLGLGLVLEMQVH